MNADPRKQRYEETKLSQRLRHQVDPASADFNMTEEGDQVLVAISGGKDSCPMLDRLLAPFSPCQLGRAYRKHLRQLGQGRTIAVGWP